MQIMVDTASDSPQMLRLTAAFLDDAAATRELELAGPQHDLNNDELAPRRSTDIPSNGNPPPPPLDPAAIFGTKQPEPGPSHGVTRIQGIEVSPADFPARFAEYATGKPPVNLQPLPLAPGPQAADEFDSAGWPYDLRIHNDKHTKKLDGTWKYRKKTPEAIIAQVEAEIAPRRRTPAAAPPIDPRQTSFIPGGEGGMHGLPPPPPSVILPQSQTQTPQAQAPQTQQTQSPQTAALSFTTVMTKITEAMAAKKLTIDQLGLFLTSKGLPPKDIVGIGGYPQLWQEVIDYVAHLAQ